MTSPNKATVFIVDDDVRMRAAMQRLLKTGLHSELFATPQGFLRRNLPDAPSCLILDVRLPGMNGIEVQSELNETGAQIPIIFIISHGIFP
jgi:FixJ family two-component response regulator